ncbi:P-loop containing nucleoside triphosphate hydrolase protein [Zychaea mexicana]|uniref:P-loop containing nucleoside triphosphate hydrolase protein n=1 Tax=Zychaea mexicana TaxID=64656 RepID=UPI0022FDB4AD|nr:P-loop containing nucleoside triphosphate hydrolase protein [Zychaea mexicana]KAI9490949.1 P-loop containing nucleoside triphosphate hydrolase protein [Zychaea mexicana]
MVNCNCGNDARHCAIIQPGTELGRWYYKCPSSSCTFFQWDDATPRQKFTASSVASFPGNGQSQYGQQVGNGSNDASRNRQSQRLRINRSFTPTEVTFQVQSVTQIRLHMRNNQHLTELLRGISTYKDDCWMIPATKQAYDRAVRTLISDTSDTITRINPLPSYIVKLLPTEEEEEEDKDNAEDGGELDADSDATTDDGQDEEGSLANHDQQNLDNDKSESAISTDEQEGNGDDETKEVGSNSSNIGSLKQKSKGKGRATHVHDDDEDYQEEAEEDDEDEEDDESVQLSAHGRRTENTEFEEQRSQKKRLRDIQGTDLWRVLKDFQRKGVVEGIKRDGRMLLGDDMGLGKTIQAIAIAYAYSDSWPVLILCPSSLRFTWKNEITRWIESVDGDDIRVITKGPQMVELAKPVVDDEGDNEQEEDVAEDTKASSSSSTASVLQRRTTRDRRCKQKLPAKRRKVQKTKFWIVSYDIATKQIDYISQAKFNFIICDESHYLKGLKTQRTKSIVPVLQKSKHVLLLSGTPAFSKPLELFSQCNALRPDIFSSLYEFGARYCAGSSGRSYGRNSVFKGASNLQELNLLLTQTVLVRRLKDDVGIELPPKTRQTVFMDVAASVKRAMKKNNEYMQKTLRAMDKPDNSGGGRSSKSDEPNKRKLMLQLYTDTAAAKIPVVKEYLEHVFGTTDQKMIIFAHHRSMLNAIEECAISCNIGYIRIDGSTHPDVRQQMCDRYQAKGSSVQVAILSLSIGVGLTLSAADLVLFAEIHWTPSTLLQAEDRAHRIGRRGPVNIVYILAPDTLDGYLWKLVKKKLSIVGAAIDGTISKVTINEASSSGFDWLGDDEQSDFERPAQEDDKDDGQSDGDVE